MLIRFFRSGFPSQHIAVAVAGILLWSRAFIYPPGMPAPDGPVFLYSLLYELLHGLPYLATLIAFVMLLFTSFWFNHILNHNELVTKNSSISAFLFIVLVSLYPPQLTLTPGNISLFLLVLVLQNMMASYYRPDHVDLVYAASFFIALGSLFYLPFLLFFGYILISFLVFRAGRWREWVAAFLGLATPFLYLAMWHWWKGNLIPEFIKYVSFFSTLFVFPLHIQYDFWVVTGFTLLLSFWSLIHILRRPLEKTAALRIKIYYFFWMIPFTFLSYIYAHSLAEYHLVLVAPAFSLVISSAVLKIKKFFWPELVLLLYVLCILLNNLVFHHLFNSP